MFPSSEKMLEELLSWSHEIHLSNFNLQDLEEEIRKKIDQVAHAQTSATKFLQEELENKSQVRDRNILW